MQEYWIFTQQFWLYRSLAVRHWKRVCWYKRWVQLTLRKWRWSSRIWRLSCQRWCLWWRRWPYLETPWKYLATTKGVAEFLPRWGQPMPFDQKESTLHCDICDNDDVYRETYLISSSCRYLATITFQRRWSQFVLSDQQESTLHCDVYDNEDD